MGKYLSMARIGFLESIAYRYEVFFGSLSILVYLFTFVILWSALYEVFSIPGFSYAQLMWYFLLAQSIRFAAHSPSEEMTALIQTGDVANFLNKPFSLFLYQFFTSLGRLLLNATIILAVGSFLLSFFVAPPAITLVSLPFVAVCVLAGIFIHFIISYAISLSAFWLEDAKPINWIYDKMIFILGGLMFPLEILPSWLQSIAGALPTAYYLYGPSKLFVGFSFDAFFRLLGVQLLFIMGLGLAVAVMARFAYKHLSVNGG